MTVAGLAGPHRFDLGVALRLGRVSNLPTVWTNVLAGIVLAGADPASALVIPVLLGASLLYVGGMYLNDAFDAEIDARHRSSRPIPAGLVQRQTVFQAGFGMLAAGRAALPARRLGCGLGSPRAGRPDRPLQLAPQGQPAEPGRHGPLPLHGLCGSRCGSCRRTHPGSVQHSC